VLAAGRGVRSCVMRLPPYVYGDGGSVFIPVQLAAYREACTAYYFGDPDHLVHKLHTTTFGGNHALQLELSMLQHCTCRVASLAPGCALCQAMCGG
jgi:hypothetical protein